MSSNSSVPHCTIKHKLHFDILINVRIHRQVFLSQGGLSFGPEWYALWARITKNTDWCTGPLARPFAHLLAPLTRLLAPHCSLAHFAHSLARGKVKY